MDYYILTEDSSTGLLFWALLNEYVFNNKFNLRFANSQGLTQNILLKDINDYADISYKQRVDEKGRTVAVSGGADKIIAYFQYLRGSRVLLALDMARYEEESEIARDFIGEAEKYDIDLRLVGYNCAADILLGFWDLQYWCDSCARKASRIFPEIKYKEMLRTIQRNMQESNGNYGSEKALPGWNRFAKLIGEDTIKGKEHIIDKFLFHFTYNSCLWCAKNIISDCWTYQCTCTCPCDKNDPNVRIIPNNVTEKWQYIYEHSYIKEKLKPIFQKWGLNFDDASNTKIGPLPPFRENSNYITFPEQAWIAELKDIRDAIDKKIKRYKSLEQEVREREAKLITWGVLDETGQECSTRQLKGKEKSKVLKLREKQNELNELSLKLPEYENLLGWAGQQTLFTQRDISEKLKLKNQGSPKVTTHANQPPPSEPFPETTPQPQSTAPAPASPGQAQTQPLPSNSPPLGSKTAAENTHEFH